MPDKTPPETGDRLAKVMARAGLCSRRDAEEWIAAGRVSVNGKTVRTPAFNVTAKDKIAVDGQPVEARRATRVWLYHKPVGLVVTENDPEGRPTVFDAVAELGLPRVVSVGRLDINTEGLLLLTNDGGLKRVLELPSTGWLRRYRVRAFGSVTQGQLDRLKDGLEVDGITYGPIEAELEREQGSNVWITVGLREGKNREVKNVLEALGLQVNRLIRISYGPFQLGDLPEGQVDVVKHRVLQEQLGKRLAEEAGADFDSELPDPVVPGGKSRPARAGEEQRPRRDRPGRYESDNRRPARAPEPERKGPSRKIHFDTADGRDSVEFVEKFKKPGDRGAPGGRGAGAARGGEGRPERAARGDRPERTFKPRSGGDRPDRGGDRPFKPRSGGDDRTKRPYAPRTEGGSGDGPKRPYAPRTERTGIDDRPKRSFAPRTGGDDRPKRPYTPRAEGSGDDRPKRPYSPRTERTGTDERPKRSFAPRTGGDDRPKRPYTPRAEGGGDDRPKRPYSPRTERTGTDERPKRSFAPRTGGDDRPKRPYAPRTEGGADRPKRPYAPRTGAGEDRPKRPFKAREGGTGDARPPRRDGGRPQGTGFKGRSDAGVRPPRRDGAPAGKRPGGAPRGDGPPRKPRTPRT